MSRIGKQSIKLKQNISVTIAGKQVAVKGPKATLEHELPQMIEAKVEGDELIVTRANDSRRAKALHGLSRSLLNNMVIGVERGFQKSLEIRGVGYRAELQGKTLVFALGFSHPVEFPIPEGIEIAVNRSIISVSGAGKQQVGQVAADIRALRKPEPYKGKGIRYVDEYVIQKEGKTV